MPRQPPDGFGAVRLLRGFGSETGTKIRRNSDTAKPSASKSAPSVQKSLCSGDFASAVRAFSGFCPLGGGATGLAWRSGCLPSPVASCTLRRCRDCGSAGFRPGCCADAAASPDSVGAVARKQRLRRILLEPLRGCSGFAGFCWSFCADAAAPPDSVGAFARTQRLRRILLELLRRRSGFAGFCSGCCADEAAEHVVETPPRARGRSRRAMAPSGAKRFVSCHIVVGFVRFRAVRHIFFQLFRKIRYILKCSLIVNTFFCNAFLRSFENDIVSQRFRAKKRCPRARGAEGQCKDRQRRRTAQGGGRFAYPFLRFAYPFFTRLRAFAQSALQPRAAAPPAAGGRGLRP